MPDSVAAIVLAAGAGTRLRPLTWFRPKPLCPVGNVPLVDLALEKVAAVVGTSPASRAVNVHHGREQLEAHLAGRAHVSVEPERPLGTAGAVSRLRPWLAGRAALVVNADAWHRADLAELCEGWDGERVRLLVAGDPAAPLGPDTGVIGSLLPWAEVERLPDGPAGLSVVCWRPREEEGRLEVVGRDVAFVDCGRPRDYLAANLSASGGESVVGEGAVVEGTLVRSVVWPGAVVHPAERLVDAIRLPRTSTVLVR